MDPLKYFSLFKYVPTVEECVRFKGFKIKGKNPKERVVTPANKKYLAQTLKRQKISLKKLHKHQRLLNFLGFFPGVEYLGISGSVSMLNAGEADDLDLFVIARAGSLWTTRFLLVLITSILGVRRQRAEKHAKDKFCLNLFFSSENLKVPKNKQTLYVAHEILQLRPIVNRHQTYERLLAANPWLKRFAHVKGVSLKGVSLEGDTLVESVLKRFQLWLINRHRTTEIITDTQLWFFPDDFEKKIKTLYS